MDSAVCLCVSELVNDASVCAMVADLGYCIYCFTWTCWDRCVGCAGVWMVHHDESIAPKIPFVAKHRCPVRKSNLHPSGRLFNLWRGMDFGEINQRSIFRSPVHALLRHWVGIWRNAFRKKWNLSKKNAAVILTGRLCHTASLIHA